MSPRPLIFISAVSRELKSARQTVANTLTFLGYQPAWQEIFGTESGDLRAIMRQQIDQCQGVVQLVGQCYGVEPPAPDAQFGRVSYTQYEALYARQRNKKVWYLFIDDTFPSDAHEPEPDELRELQAAYRRRLQSDTHAFHPLKSSEALEASVLKLRDDLTRLRRVAKRWAVSVIMILLFLLAGTVWLVQMQLRQTEVTGKQDDRSQKMEQALARLADVQAQSRQTNRKLSPDEQRADAYAFLEKEIPLPAGTLAKELPAFALELYNRGDTAPLMRARAAYAIGRFDEAEKLSLESAERDRHRYESAQRVAEERRKGAMEGYELAGQSAQQRLQYADALKHFREAESLTDRDRNPKDWAEVQYAIAHLLIDQGQYSDAENLLRGVVSVRTHVMGAEHPDTLRSRNGLDMALWLQEKLEEAEADFRELIKLEEKVLGREHPDTLKSRNCLAGTLVGQGKYAQAEAQFREVIKIQEKVLRPEHPDTLMTRGNLADALDHQGKYAEAEAQFREVIRIEEKVLGPEHPETLGSRSHLAQALVEQGKHTEAEAQYRKVIEIAEKVLGPEHPNTFMTRGNLAIALADQGKYAEAEVQYRAVIEIAEKVLGAKHPDVLATRANLASALEYQGKYAEAEAQFREVIKMQEQVSGSEHPSTLATRANLASALDRQGRYAEAEAQFREVIKTQEKVLGAEHPATLSTRANLAGALDHQSKDAEAETLFREVIKLQEKVLGTEHPDILASCYEFALGLKRRNKLQEAKEFARRATEGARKMKGPNHASTQKYERLLAELETANDAH